MSPKHFFFSPERHPGASNLDSRTGGEAITVIANRPSDPDSQEVFVGISMDYSSADKGEAWAAVDANEVRDAIDRAVGKREEGADFSPLDEADLAPYVAQIRGFVEATSSLAAPAKPYRPIDRDRLLRHIEDVEASLTRRNERHERDQERIRGLEAEVKDLHRIVDLREEELAETKTAREYLQMAWENATVPEDGMIHEGEGYLFRFTDGGLRPGVATATHPAHHGMYRLLEPRVEPAEEYPYRKDLESKGLAEWEIELLVGAAS